MKRWINTRVRFDADGNEIEREGYWYEGPVAEAVAMAAFDQDSYAFYNDDGSESAATIIGTKNTQQTLQTNTTYHCRILIQETGGASGNLNTPEFEYNHNGAGWNDITTSSSVVKAVDSSNLTGGGDTTQRLGAGTFISTNGWVSEDGAQPTLSFGASEECEGLLAFQIVGADVSNGDEILIRMFGADSYTRNADIDVAAGADVTGTLAASTPIATASIAGKRKEEGALAGTAPIATAAFAGKVTQVIGDLAGAAPLATAAFVGEAKTSGALAGTTPLPTAALAGEAKTAGALAGSTPIAIAALVGARKEEGALAASTPIATAALAGTVTQVIGDLAASTPVATAAFAGEAKRTGALAAVAPMPTAAFAGARKEEGALAASAPLPTAAFAGDVSTSGADVTGALAAATPLATATFAGTAKTSGALAATTPLVIASFAGNAITSISGALAGSLPMATASLVGTAGAVLPVIVGPTGTEATTPPSGTDNVTGPAAGQDTLQASGARFTTGYAATQTEIDKVGAPWFINSQDSASALEEQIVRPAYSFKGVDYPLKAIDISAATGAVEYWNGTAWTPIAGSVVIADSGDVDGDGSTIYKATFTRSAGATSAIASGRYSRRWVFTFAGSNLLTVPEKGEDVMVVNPDPQ